MIIIRFANQEMKRRALGYLTGRFSFKSWATGEMMVPEASLPFMAAEGIQYFVEGALGGPPPWRGTTGT
jgi:hypothetical protein